MEELGRPIIVLGVDRSGTSLVAQLVHRFGAYGGNEERLGQGDVHNPRGYWENGPLARLLVELFWDPVLQFWQPGFEEALVERAADPRFRGPAEELAKAMARQSRIWYWKEPLLCVLLPFWTRIWGEPAYVITVRNPYDSAVSWERFRTADGLPGPLRMIAANLLRWQLFLLSVLRHTEGARYRLFVSYEDLVRDPAGQCDRLARFLTAAAGTPREAAARAARMARAVDRRLWRRASCPDLRDVPEATPEQVALYDLLRRKVADPDAPFDPDLYPLYPGWREMLANLEDFEAYYRRTARVMRWAPVRLLMGLARAADRLRDGLRLLAARREPGPPSGA